MNIERALSFLTLCRDEATGPGGAARRQDHAATMPSAGHQRFPVQNHDQGQQFPQMPSSPQYSSQRGGRQPSELLSDDLVQQQYGLQVAADGYHGGHDPSGSAKQGQGSNGKSRQLSRVLFFLCL